MRTLSSHYHLTPFRTQKILQLVLVYFLTLISSEPKVRKTFLSSNFFLFPLFFYCLPRVHCFHYLIPLTKQGNYAIVANVESMDYDPLVVKLNKDISAIEEAMGAALQQHKFQYIFEGQLGLFADLKDT